MIKGNGLDPDGGLRRKQTNFFANLERRVLPGLVRKTPAWVTPDMLTLASVFAAFAVAIVLNVGASNFTTISLVWLFLFLHWFFVSTDGALAEYRKEGRGFTGFLIDRSADTISFSVIFIGLGISPWLELKSGLLLAICFCIHQITSIFFTLHQKTTLIGIGGFGATEARLVIWLCIAVQVNSQSYLGQMQVFGMLLERFVSLVACGLILFSSLRLIIRARRV